MLADPDTLRIIAVPDFEFTNAMPAQYADDVPWWLLLQQPATWISEGSFQQFLDLFQPRKEQFIRAMERAESGIPLVAGESRLSARMRDSWNTGGWFNLASRSSFDIDEAYWETLHKSGLGEALMDRKTVEERDRFIRLKRLSLKITADKGKMTPGF
ncbi:hypothetical protein CTA2_3722 [Colletotrichum tanaceti]|uniref:Uncharacterized protein n=1 Tax=Colletotrichum tanaceti TaxID=1306861 RepID=A0A4U6X7E4_9PEZI|nr:hypothetical protein CTA2_3722 [Colletotrichum tanaceti]TKW51245.1 hypothetical protein CTA1_1383 [Colletotrichum tanaceti]